MKETEENEFEESNSIISEPTPDGGSVTLEDSEEVLVTDSYVVEVVEDSTTLNIFENSTAVVQSNHSLLSDVSGENPEKPEEEGTMKSLILQAFGDYHRPSQFTTVFYNGEPVAETEVYESGIASLDFVWFAGVLVWVMFAQFVLIMLKGVLYYARR